MIQRSFHNARLFTLEWDKLRTGSVSISGTDYLPPVPNFEEVENGLRGILESERTVTEKAQDVFAWRARGQFFWAGNKRTAMTMANKLLLSAGAGLLTITDQYMERFFLLVKFRKLYKKFCCDFRFLVLIY